ncbi:hypothetical protein Golax_020139, partial [Gossypium laxum]|nr:hypothetical protein [Gossypium laxum]
MVDRGHCKFTTKANNAQAANASALLIINNQKERYWSTCALLKVKFVSSRAELYKMVCDPDETDLDIHIPTVMLPQDAGVSLEKMLTSNSSVSVQLYSPKRPLVDIAEVFLWLMADPLDEIPDTRHVGSGGLLNINTTSAVLFVVFASCFLIMLYKLMAYWFVELLVVLFCIGGV